MKRVLLFLTAGVLSLLLFGALPGCGDMNLAPKSRIDEKGSEVTSEVKTEAGAIQALAPAQPAPQAVPAAEEEEEDQFGC